MLCAALEHFMSVLTLTLLAGPLVGQAVADDRYYVIFFASQAEPRRPRLSHTFCTFIKAESGSAHDPLAEPKFTAQTISWLPVSGDVCVLRFRPERGRNFTLAETLRLARATGQSVWSWGPYEVSADIYKAWRGRNPGWTPAASATRRWTGDSRGAPPTAFMR